MMEQLFKLSELETPHLRQHERAGRRRDAQGRLARRGAQAMARPSPRRAGAPLAPSARRDREAARTDRRPGRRLPQSRRGDPHHPRGGRSEGGADRAFLAERNCKSTTSSTRACARCAGSRKWRSARSRTNSSRRRPTSTSLLASEKRQWQAIAYQIRDVRKKYGRRRRSAAAAQSFEAPPDVVIDVAQSLVEREPLTVDRLAERDGSAR